MLVKYTVSEFLSANGSFSSIDKHVRIIRIMIIEKSTFFGIQSSTTPDPGYQWESDNVTIRHHKREPKGQPFSSR